MIKLSRITMALIMATMVSCSKEEIEPSVDVSERFDLNKNTNEFKKGSDFVTTWEGTQITIPTDSNFTYYYNVDWDNDGMVDETGLTRDATHKFESSGSHTIRISGTFPTIAFEKSTQENRNKIIAVNQWGQIKWRSMYHAFYYCENLEILAKDSPYLNAVKSLNGMFWGAGVRSFEASNWDVSQVEDMSSMFFNSKFEKINVDNWNVSNARDMSFMFCNTNVAYPGLLYI